MFLQRVQQKTGRVPMIYTSVRVFNSLLGGPAGFKPFPLWVASWNVRCPNIPNPPWTRWTFWQSSATGTVAGFSDPVDCRQLQRDVRGPDGVREGPVGAKRARIAVARIGVRWRPWRRAFGRWNRPRRSWGTRGRHGHAGLTRTTLRQSSEQPSAHDLAGRRGDGERHPGRGPRRPRRKLRSGSPLELRASSAVPRQRYAAPAVADDRPPAELSEHSYGRELFAKLGQAAEIGQSWAERICGASCVRKRRGRSTTRGRWRSRDSRSRRFASSDPRLLEPLARACSAGAAAWWERRPMRYRIAPATWHLETAPDERELCMFVADGVRCERRTEWLIGSAAALAYAYLCGVHLDFVRQPGQPAEAVEQTNVR